MNEQSFLTSFVVAMEQSDPTPAFRTVFEAFRDDPACQMFTDAVRRHVADHHATERVAHDLAAALATEMFDGTDKQRRRALELIRSKPAWQKELVYWMELAQPERRMTELIITRDGQPFAETRVTEEQPASTIQNIRPGHYRIQLHTGWVLWERQFLAEDVFLGKGDTQAPIKLAATTDEVPELTQQEWSGAAGLVVRLSQGFESAALLITISNDYPNEGHK